MTLTNAELFNTIDTWTRWNTADYDARIAEQDGQHATAENLRQKRDQQQEPDPLEALRNARTLTLRLQEARWDMITEARLRGATWDEVAHAMNEPTINVCADYTTMVDWVDKNRPSFVDLNRYCRAL